MDDVLEENLPNHALKEQREMAEKYRNIGIGIMGLHDALIKLGIVYGSSIAVSAVSDLAQFIFKNSVKASAKLAETRGNFPGYSEKIWESNIIKNAFLEPEIEELKKNNKLRNCSLLSIAPTGSLGTMLNVSTGIEPLFALEYNRKTVSLNGSEEIHKVHVPIIEEALQHDWKSDCYITSHQIDYKKRIDMQSAIQQYIDTAISSTINLPENTTPEDIQNLYLYAWQKGLKGVTVYRDGSRDPILSTSSSEQKKSLKSPENGLKMNSIQPLSRDEFGEVLSGRTYKYKSACGTLYVTLNHDEDGNIVEIFTNSSKNGTCKANLNGETRMASLALRAGVKVDEVIDQLKGIHCQSCAFAKAKGIKVDGMSCPDIIAKCIKASYEKDIENKISCFRSGHVCPECGKELIASGGCWICECGYSKCG